jgi:septal ring factor EnvC (AmiA/AmiB activator)
LNLRRVECGVLGHAPGLALMALLLLVPLSVPADRDAELKQLRQHIERLQSELDEARGERNEAREKLRDAERRIGTLIRNLRDTDRRLRTESSRLRDLEAARTRARLDRHRQQQELEAAVRAAYALGRQETVKLLLSQDDPARASRVLVYYRYLADARTTRISQLNGTVTRLNALESEIGSRQQELTALRQQQQEKKQSLETTRAERRVALIQLNEQVRTRSQEIERLQRNEERLGRLVRGLREAMPPPPVTSSIPPSTGKGKWRLPVQGRIMARYGQTKSVGNLRWRGLFVATGEGRPIQAVTSGRVAYADWLRGFGLLMVIDHGNGVMTLYGHNQSLMKGVGEPVESGEVIALSGNTGGPPEPGLYFEVRQNGEPRNPLDWCKL